MGEEGYRGNHKRSHSVRECCTSLYGKAGRVVGKHHIKKALWEVHVENHQQDQIRRSKIKWITPIPMSQLIFPVDERGTRMTIVQCFVERYNYRLHYTSWPCLSGNDSRPVYLPMEMVLQNMYAEEFGIKVCSDMVCVPACVLPPPMAFCPRSLLDTRSASPNNIENALRDVHRRTTEKLTKQEMGSQLQLLIVIYLKSVVLTGELIRSARLILGLYLNVA